jgi:hypothetical protein
MIMINRHALTELLVVIAIALLLDGCVSEKSTVKTSTSKASMQSSMLIDDSEGDDACNLIAQHLTYGEDQSLYEMFDVDSILNRILSTFDEKQFTSDEYLNFKRGLRKLIRNRNKFRSDNVRWDVVRGHIDGDKYLCLVRASLLAKRLFYTEFELRNVEGRLQVVDWYDLLREISMTEMVTELYHDIHSLINARKMVMPHQKAALVLEQKQYFGFLSALGSADPARIMSAYYQLPVRFKNKPLYKFDVLYNMLNIDKALHYRALRDFEREFSKTGNHAFLFIKLYLSDNDYDKATQVIEVFKGRVGEDPLLDLLLAEIEYRRGNKKAFYGMCLQLLNDNPNYHDTYWYLFDRFVADRHYNHAVIVLNVLSKMFEYTFFIDAFKSDKKYLDFTKSSAFKAWKRDYS